MSDVVAPIRIPPSTLCSTTSTPKPKNDRWLTGHPNLRFTLCRREHPSSIKSISGSLLKENFCKARRPRFSSGRQGRTYRTTVIPGTSFSMVARPSRGGSRHLHLGTAMPSAVPTPSPIFGKPGRIVRLFKPFQGGFRCRRRHHRCREAYASGTMLPLPRRTMTTARRHDQDWRMNAAQPRLTAGQSYAARL